MTVGEREPDAAGFIGWYAAFLGEVCPSGIRYDHFTNAATAGSLLNHVLEEHAPRALADLQKNTVDLFTQGELITVYCMGGADDEEAMRAALSQVAAGSGQFGGRQFGHDIARISDDMGVSVAVMIQFPILST